MAVLPMHSALHLPQGSPGTPSVPAHALKSSPLPTVRGPPPRAPLNCDYCLICFPLWDGKWVLLMIFVRPEPSTVPSPQPIVEKPLLT